MAKLIAVCGKICSGKSYYSRHLSQRENAVILSGDELTKALFENDLGEKHDEMTARIQAYFRVKSLELLAAGCSVILDWGFWSRSSRKALTEYYKAYDIPVEWHYIDVDDATWQRNIAERNARVASGNGGSDYYLDEGLLSKLLLHWETPEPSEIHIWHKSNH